MSSIVDSPESYFRQLAPAVGPLLEELEEEARREKIPIVGPVVGTLLYLLARVAQARVILELDIRTAGRGEPKVPDRKCVSLPRGGAAA